MMGNLDLWDKLGRTDPKHTKAFKRSGGFGGTAIKPIYTEQKMTEEFGPCGTGWGFSEPVFQTVTASEGQVAVYCWLSLWYVLEGKRSEPVFGVGGDMVVVKQSNGLRTDDEAFKKAFTDAIGNAMKHIGMSADVHMGLFDDSKYVNELKDEVAKASRTAEKPVQPPMNYNGHLTAISSAPDLEALKTALQAANANKSLTAQDKADLATAKDARKAQLNVPDGYIAPTFEDPK